MVTIPYYLTYESHYKLGISQGHVAEEGRGNTLSLFIEKA